MLFLSLFIVPRDTFTCTISFLPCSRKMQTLKQLIIPKTMNLALKRRNFFLKTMKLQYLDTQKQKKKTNIHFICFAFWQINATFSWKHELWITLSIISRVLAKCIHVLTLNKVIWHAYRWIPITRLSVHALRYVFWLGQSSMKGQ